MRQNESRAYANSAQIERQSQSRVTSLDQRERAEFAVSVAEGFSRELKCVASRWLYDAEGSQIFSRITHVPEYYLTSREIEILEVYGAEMARTCGQGPWRVCELGCGDGRKTEILLREWKKQAQLEFWPIDVSATALDEFCARMQRRLPEIPCHPLIADNFEGLTNASQDRLRARLAVLHLGSSVGNCERAEVDVFLSRLRERLSPGDVTLIGFDLLKDSARLVRAYDDSAGVTRDFNLNLLRRMNRDLDANFEVDWFRHEATWNPAIGGMESWLVSLRDQVVRIGAIGRSYRFRKWEPVRTEISLKFDPDSLGTLAEKHGFKQLRRFEDAVGDFTDALWMATSSSLS